MRGHERPGCQRKHVFDTCQPEVADVEDDAQLLHLPERSYAFRGQAAARCCVQAASVGEKRTAEVRHGDHWNPDPRHGAHQLRFLSDGMGTLEGDHESDAPGRCGDVDVRGRQAHRHVGAVLGRELVDPFDKQQRPTQCPFGLELLLDEDRQHLHVDAPGAQLR